MSDRAVEILERVEKTLENNDRINHRLITALIVVGIAGFLAITITITSAAYFYFCNENSYPQINQTQIQSDNSSPTIKAGKGDK